MNPGIHAFNKGLTDAEQAICDLIAATIDRELTESEGKIWHAHPVWFLNGNPIVGYCKQKRGIRLMFWSGADFGEEALDGGGGKFRDASRYYNNVNEVVMGDLIRWLQKSQDIQWDYKNIVKRKGRLERLK